MHRERTLKIYRRVPLQNSGSRWGYACEKTTQGQGKNDPRGLEGAVPGIHTELGIVPIPTSQPGNPHNSWDVGKCIHKGLVSVVGNN